MPTYDISGFAQYQVDTSNNNSLFQGTTVQSFTFNDGEGDTTYENGDVLGNISGNDLNYLGNMQVPLVGGGSMELLLVQGAARFTDPQIIEVLIVVPAAMSVTDFNFPDPIDYAARETDPFVTCFAAGTRIATPQGSCAVESLRPGDPVRSASGDVVPVTWIGRKTLQRTMNHAYRQLVRIRAGALGHGLPHADLTVTADHGMLVDGLVINASALVNGTSIGFVPVEELPPLFTVYHIETEQHDVILANGAPSETFVDVLTRKGFDNYDEYLDLCGTDRIIPVMDRPRISAQRLLPAGLRARLGINAQALSA